MSTNAFAQRLTATGKVTDAAGLEVIGASVLEKGTANGVVTNLDGEFSLSVGQNATLVISFIGYKTIEVKATTNMNITLQEDNELLDEVVVIGYGSVKRKDVTTAVSTVSTKDLDQRPIVSAAQALQGKAAGVSVMQPSGEPGGGMSIRVRGTTSFNGSNDPLYVVDGVPVDNINFLSPNDIESLSILKDASSAAIYGSRAANGVVLITTKAGAEGNAKVALNVQYGMTKVAKSMDALNTEQYRELQEEIGAVNPAALEGLTDQTDWFDEVYKTGQTQNYQVSVSNGNEKMKYFLSAGYLNEKGILEGTYFKRYSFRANIDNQIRSWLNVSANISYSDNIGNTGIISGTGANRGGVVLSVINTPTYAPIWDPEKPNQYNKNFYGVNIMNPMENLARQKNNKNKENRLIASGAATISFLPNLKLKSSVALDRRNGVSTTFLDPISTTDGRNSFGTASDNRNMNTVLVFDNILTYNTNIKKHGIDVMAGSSYTKSDYTNSWINGSHFRDDKIQTLNAANKISWDGTGTGASQWAISSYFARVSYNYDSKYMLTMNMRADGSSKLHPDHRWVVSLLLGCMAHFVGKVHERHRLD
jgi:Outer membrane receptor for ferrienterochelin and colicins